MLVQSSTTRAKNATATAVRRPRVKNGNSTDTVTKAGSDDYLKYFTKGNKVTALYDASVTPKIKQDEIFQQVRLALDAARSSIQLEMFGFGQKDIAEMLVTKKQDGLNVQVVLDPINPELAWENEKAEMVEILEKGGVDVHFYPVQSGDSEGGKKRFAQIDHVKMLVTDGTKAIIGGMNWGSHSPINHDVDIMVEGPIVDRMQNLFKKDFIKSGGRAEDLPAFVRNAENEGGSLVSLCTTSEDPKDRSIKATLHRAIGNATKSIEAELFVFTDYSLIDALKKAKTERNVDVKVVMNPFEIEGKKLNEPTAEKLRQVGIEVKWHVADPEKKDKLHAKLCIIDGEETILGSANWSGAGMTWNHEADVDIIDKTIAGQYQSMFKNDWKKAADTPTYID